MCVCTYKNIYIYIYTYVDALLTSFRFPWLQLCREACRRSRPAAPLRAPARWISCLTGTAASVESESEAAVLHCVELPNRKHGAASASCKLPGASIVTCVDDYRNKNLPAVKPKRSALLPTTMFSCSRNTCS